jgi:hypothetical protein
MSTASVENRRRTLDDTAVRVVRALMSWHGLAMPDVAAVIDASIGTVERRLSRNPKTRKSWQGWELHLLADYFGVPVSAFYTGEVDLSASRLGGGADPRGQSTWNVSPERRNASREPVAA